MPVPVKDPLLPHVAPQVPEASDHGYDGKYHEGYQNKVLFCFTHAFHSALDYAAPQEPPRS